MLEIKMFLLAKHTLSLGGSLGIELKNSFDFIRCWFSLLCLFEIFLKGYVSLTALAMY
jgi:hypothetical protein